MLSTRNAGPTNGVTSLVKKIMKDVTWDVRILDEAHCAPAHTHRAFLDKNRDGVASKYIRTICLTGTLVRDESLKERMSSYETERVELQRRAAPTVLTDAQIEERLDEKYFESDFAWLGRKAFQKKWIDQQNDGCIAKMHFAKVGVCMTEDECKLVQLVRTERKNPQTARYIEELLQREKSGLPKQLRGCTWIAETR